MKKYFSKMAMLLTVALFLIGIVLILTATSMGNKKGEEAIRKNGGSMETARYNRIIETSTLDYRTAGTVIGLVGGFGMISMGSAIYRELD